MNDLRAVLPVCRLLRSPTPALTATFPKRSGFTLIEVMVAIVLFALMVMPAAGILYAEGKLQRKYEEKSRAMLIAKSEIERWKAWPGDLKDRAYDVPSHGRSLVVRLRVKTGEGALQFGTRFIRPEILIISVADDKDRVLCELQVMRETYK